MMYDPTGSDSPFALAFDTWKNARGEQFMSVNEAEELQSCARSIVDTPVYSDDEDMREFHDYLREAIANPVGSDSVMLRPQDQTWRKTITIQTPPLERIKRVLDQLDDGLIINSEAIYEIKRICGR